MSIKGRFNHIHISRLESAAVSTIAAFFTVLLFIRGVAHPWFLNPLPQKQSVFTAVSPNTKQAHIFFSPSNLATTAGIHTVSIYVDSGGNKIGQVTLKMKYNPQVMQIASLLPVDYTQKPYDTTFSVKSISNDVQNGTLTFTINAQARNNNYPLPPVFQVANLTFNVIGTPSTNVISFLPGTAIYPQVGTAVAGEEDKASPVSILGSVQPLQNNPKFPQKLQ